MAMDAEKNITVEQPTEINSSKGSNSDLNEYLLPDDDPRIKKIKRKADLRICTLLGALYMFAAIDRVNLANAVVAGMAKELNMQGNAYTLLILVFFPFYITFQWPMVAIGRRIGARWFLSSIVILWGIVMVCHGVVNDWRPMLALRCLLGIFEAGYFSMSTYLLNSWYTRQEVGKRNAWMYLLGTFLGGFGGILAYGLQQMNGVGGKSGWRWILIMDGVITVALGLLAILLIVDFPEKAASSWKFLDETEVKYVLARLENDRRDTVLTPFHLKEYLSYALDWTLWCHAGVFCFSSVVNYSVAYFLPIVLRNELGFSLAAAQCLPAPTYVFAMIVGFTFGTVSDKINKRIPFFVANALFMIMGVCILGFAKPSGARYFGAFFVVAGGYGNVPLVITYQNNNLRGQWKRAFSSSLTVAGGGLGGIIGSLVFRSQDAPAYRPGLYTCLVSAFICLLCGIATTIAYARRNRLQAQGRYICEGEEHFRYTL